MNAKLQAWWLARTENERRTLALGGLGLALLLLIGGVVLPLSDHHHALAERLPGLRASAAALEAQADEAVALRARAGPAPVPAMSMPGGAAAAALQASLDAAGLRGAGDSVLAQGNEQVEIRLAHAGFDAFLSWLARTQRDTGMRPLTLEADALDAPGSVRIHCVLAAAGGH